MLECFPADVRDVTVVIVEVIDGLFIDVGLSGYVDGHVLPYLFRVGM